MFKQTLRSKGIACLIALGLLTGIGWADEKGTETAIGTKTIEPTLVFEYKSDEPIVNVIFSEATMTLTEAKKQKKILDRIQRDISIIQTLNNPKDLARYKYQLGRKYKRLKLYEEAISCFNQVISLDPNGEFVIKVYYHLNDCYQAQNKPENAFEITEKLVAIDPKARYADEALLTIAYYYQNKDWKKANKIYEQIIKMYPKSNSVDDALCFLSNNYKSLGCKEYGIEKVIGLYKELAAKLSDLKYILWIKEEMGNLYLSLGKEQKAINSYEEYLKNHSSSVCLPRVLSSMAKISLENGDWQKAIKLYYQAVEIVRKSEYKSLYQNTRANSRYWSITQDIYSYPSYYYQKIAEIYCQRKEYRKAINKYRKAIKYFDYSDFCPYGIYDNHFLGYYYNKIGEIYEILGKYLLAAKEYKKAIDSANNKDTSIYQINGIIILGEDESSFYQNRIENILFRYIKSLDEKFVQKLYQKRSMFQRAKEEKNTPRLKMVYIPSGEFIMGSEQGDDDEKPIRKVWVNSFFIDKYEVTNKQYERFVKETGYPPPSSWEDGKIPLGLENYPVVNVSFNDASVYAEWAGKRLPKEEEWEKAARGIEGRIYPWGDEYKNGAANLYSTSTTSVGSFFQDKSIYGCYDMAGNVSEWTDSKWPSSDENPILKGGNWYDNCEPYYARSSYRYYDYSPHYNSIGIGFRCIKDIGIHKE
ncbi:MAG: SUMF1/EgtB/PvdO family nonheme iron enzyme [bacterium]